MSLIKIVAIEGYIQTTYLAVYPDKLLLLDAGCRCDVDNILTYITETLERPVSQLKTVVVSHMHPDHAGGAELLRAMTGCKIVSSMTAKPWYHGVKGRVNHLNDLALTYFVAHRNGKAFKKVWYHPILKIDHEVSDNDPVPYFEDWLVMETPGHTDCDLSLWHEQSGQIYTADLILKIKGKFTSPYLISLPFTYQQSLYKVKKLQPKKILLAHGEKSDITVEDFDKLIARSPNEPRKITLKRGLQITFSRLQRARRQM